MDKTLIRHIRKTIIERERKRILSLKAEMDAERTWSDRLADGINMGFGSMGFFVFHILLFSLWILINVKLIPGIEPFDPFPFGLLTMVVSLEAIFLSIFVLISQNRASKVADLREEISLQVNVKAEQEITRMLIMLDEMHEKLGLKSNHDAEFNNMKKKTDIFAIKKEILEELENL